MNAISKSPLTFLDNASPFDEAHERYADLGYHVLPIAEGGKYPAIVQHGEWEKFAGWPAYRETPADEQRRGAWSRMVDKGGYGAGIGILLNTPAGVDAAGQACVTVAIDFDPSPACQNEDEIQAAIMSVVSFAPVKRGQRGATALVRMPAHLAARGFDFAGPDGSKVQLLVNAQTVVPPSIHPETEQPYIWREPRILPHARDLPVLDPAALGAALAPLGYGTGGGGKHASVDAKAQREAEADIAVGEVRPDLIAGLDAATGRLGALWREGADAEFMQASLANGRARDVTGNGRRLELARQMSYADYTGAEFASAIENWPHAVGKGAVTPRDVARTWAVVRKATCDTADHFDAVDDAAEPGPAAPRARTIEERLAEYSTRFPKVIYGGEVRLAVRTRLANCSTQLDLVTPAKFPPFAPGDWVKRTEGNRVRKSHLVVDYMALETPILAGLRFVPGRAQDECGDWLNTWQGWGVTPAEAGSCELLKLHLLERVCGGTRLYFDYLWSWMAQMVQQPERKPGVAVVLQGAKGCGKSIVGDVLARLIGPGHRAVVKDREHVLGRFNGHLADAMLIQIEEAVWARDPKGEGILKSLITETDMTVERKGIEASRGQSFARILMTSNEDFVVPATVGERRFFVLRMTNPNIAGPIVQAMMAELNAEGYARLMFELRAVDLADFDPVRCPATAALAEQIAENLPPVEEWFAGERDDGGLWQAFAGADGKVHVPGKALRDRFDSWASKRRAGQISDQTWAKTLIELGLKKVKRNTGNVWLLPPREECDPA